MGGLYKLTRESNGRKEDQIGVCEYGYDMIR